MATLGKGASVSYGNRDRHPASKSPHAGSPSVYPEACCQMVQSVVGSVPCEEASCRT